MIKHRMVSLLLQKPVRVLEQIRPAGVKKGRGYRLVEPGFEQQYPDQGLVLKYENQHIFLSVPGHPDICGVKRFCIWKVTSGDKGCPGLGITGDQGSDGRYPVDFRQYPLLG